jgi:hypothetical protein
MKTRTGHFILEAQVAEMQSDLSVTETELVPVAKELLEAVAEGDDNPLFVTMNIATEGVSKNGRNYTREVIQSMADQINAEAVDGNNGHLTAEERATKRPDPVTLWLGARTLVKNGKLHLYAKGYVMPEETRLRSYLKKAKAVGKNVAVSVFGKAEKAVFNAQAKAYDLVNFTLQSIDWARSKSEGIPNDNTLILASEMVDEDKEVLAMKRSEVLQSATAEELRTHNPDLVAEMEQAAVEAAGVPVSEMEQITEVLGENPLEAVAEMQTQVREYELDKQLQAKVKVRGARPLIRDMVIGEMAKVEDKSSIDVSEMVDTFLAGDEAKALISEHRAKAPLVNPLSPARGESTPARQFTNIKPRTKK